jgi:hypothetical protein
MTIQSRVGGGERELVALSQLFHSVIEPLGFSKRQFRAAMQPLLDSMRVHEASPGLVVIMKQHGALHPRTSNCNLATMATTMQLLASIRGLPESVVEGVRAQVPAGLQQQMQLVQQPAAAATASEILPTTIPQYTGGGVDVGRYGILSVCCPFHQKKRLQQAFERELALMQPWQQNVFQLDRPAELTRLAPTSWGTFRAKVNEYQGFLWHCMGKGQPCMADYLDAASFVQFIGFLQARGVDKAGQLKATHAAIRVVSWLVATASRQQVGKAREVLAWVHALHVQMRGNLLPRPRPDRDPVVMQQEGRWMDAPLLVQRVVEVHSRASKALDQLLAKWEQQGPPAVGGSKQELEVARMVHNAIFCCMCFGYLPPLRSSILTSLTFGTSQCTHPNCQSHLQAAGCKGNRVFEDPVSCRWRLEAVHHKNTPK